MNWYPTIYHPVTKQPINLFSEEVNELLSEGYTEKFLLNQKRITHQSPFHHIEDIDYEKMMHMGFRELKLLCSTNKYAYKLCQDKNFWMKKFYYDKLYIPNKELLATTTNWLKAYYMLEAITEYMNESSVEDKSKALITKDIIPLLHKHNTEIIDEHELKQIWFYKENDIYVVMFKGKINKRYYDLDEVDLTKDQLVNFLYEGLMTGAITKLEEV
jgi:hypothetical protein